jgi:voltage-dependent calcium channel L type alpha-1D
MLVCVIGNTVCLALYNPLIPEDWPIITTLDILGHIFLAFFAAEAIIRVIAKGFVLHPNSYLRDPWNVFDLIVVIMGYEQKSLPCNM